MIKPWVRVGLLAAGAGMLVMAIQGQGRAAASVEDYASRGYAEVASFAQTRANNAEVAGYFAERSRALAEGLPIDPGVVTQWRLPPAVAREAAAARLRLMAA